MKKMSFFEDKSFNLLIFFHFLLKQKMEKNELLRVSVVQKHQVFKKRVFYMVFNNGTEKNEKINLLLMK